MEQQLKVHKAKLKFTILRDIYFDCDSIDEGKEMIYEIYPKKLIYCCDNPIMDSDDVKMEIEYIKKLSDYEEKEYFKRRADPYDRDESIELEFEKFIEEY